MGAGAGGRLIAAALRCYPARWRQRHADEAAEVAALLIRDGTPPASIACSYLVGARPPGHPALCPVPAAGHPRPGVRRASHACSR